jgi:pimeloyl-ACP methyl ester carboxylesterase
LILDSRIELPGSTTRVLEGGGGSTRTVLLLHGVTGSAATWGPYLSTLPEGVRGIAYDALGCGYTERNGSRRPITPDDQRAQLVEVIDALGVERFTGVGHSMGCGALLGLAWRDPERIDALLLTAPAALGRRRLGPLLRLTTWPPAARALERGAPAIVPAMVRGRLRALTAKRPVPGELREREAGHALARPRELVRGFVDTVGHTDMRLPSVHAHRWRQIRQPVWILRGADDHDWMPEAHEACYAELIPTAQILRWEGVGHSPHIEAPERFRELLDTFLDSTNDA